jgi:hypothetical protein
MKPPLPAKAETIHYTSPLRRTVMPNETTGDRHDEEAIGVTEISGDHSKFRACANECASAACYVAVRKHCRPETAMAGIV